MSAVSVLLLGMAACGDDPEEPRSDATPPATSPAAPPRDTAAPTGTATDQPTETTEGPVDETSEEPRPPAEITIGAAGDILPHARVVRNANANAGGGAGDYDFSPMFAEVTPLLSTADVTLCHLESPLSPDNSNLTVPNTLVFNSPWQVAEALAGAGFDGCDFASNHTLDRGVQGIADTAQVVDDAGMEYAGPGPDEASAGQPAWYSVGDVRVAQLAYTYTVFNAGMPNTDVPGDAPWLSHYLWPGRGAEGIVADAEQARSGGADFVVVSMHWGNEYWTEPTEQQRELAEEMLSSGAVDLILGTHVHVIQPCEKINDRYVLYGLGNFLSNQSPDTTGGVLRAETQEGMVAHVTLSRDADGQVSSRLQVQPTRVEIEGHVIQLATPDRHATTYQRTMDTMRLLGEGSCDAEPMP